MKDLKVRGERDGGELEDGYEVLARTRKTCANLVESAFLTSKASPV